MNTFIFVNFLGIFGLTAVSPVWGNSEVEMINATYSCCDQPHIPFDPSCENWWMNKEHVTFAKHEGPGLEQGCEPPCKKLNSEVMLLTECAEVHVRTVCKDRNRIVKDRRTSIKSVPCSASVRDAPGLVGLLLSGLILMVMTKL